MFPYRKMLGPDVVLGWWVCGGRALFSGHLMCELASLFRNWVSLPAWAVYIRPGNRMPLDNICWVVFATSPVLGPYDFFNAMYIISSLPSVFMLWSSDSATSFCQSISQICLQPYHPGTFTGSMIVRQVCQILYKIWEVLALWGLALKCLIFLESPFAISLAMLR